MQSFSEISAGLIKKFPYVKEESGQNVLTIPNESLLEVAQYLKTGPFAFDNLHCITAIERNGKVELVYALYSISGHHALTLKIYLSTEDLKIESLTPLWKSANWLEREVYDLFGVTFLNHPDLRRILNPYDWKVHPLRKNYVHPEFKTKPRL